MVADPNDETRIGWRRRPNARSASSSPHVQTSNGRSKPPIGHSAISKGTYALSRNRIPVGEHRTPSLGVCRRRRRPRRPGRQPLLTQAMRDRASDIHIEPQDNSLRVRFRIDGALTSLQLPMAMAPAS